MTAIEAYRGRDLAAVEPATTTNAVADLAEWAASAQAAYTVAENLVRTSFVPAAFTGKPHEATAAILAGMEIGLSPMAALRSFDVIQGQAAPRALTLRAVVQAAGHQIWTDSSTATKAVVKGRRRGSDKDETSVWTIERAREMGLTNKDQWKKQPTAMLLARATAECARLVAADAILGIPYAAEELSDDAAPDGPTRTVSRAPAEETTEKPARKSAAARVTKAAAPAPVADEPPLDDAPNPVAQALAEDPITSAQLTKLAICIKESELDRDTTLALYADETGRTVESSKALTKAEASRIIDKLTQMIDAAKAHESQDGEIQDAEVVDDELPL